MVLVTLECWSRQRNQNVSILLSSLLNQTFKDWGLTLLEEIDTQYIQDLNVRGLLRLLRNKGHSVTFMHPKRLLGCVDSSLHVMNETKSKYAVKLDDDHIFESDVLEKLVMTLEENDDIGAVGGMLHPVDRNPVRLDKIPSDFNRWTGKEGKIWNDYSTLNFSFDEQIVDVDFLRAPIMYRADLLHETDFLEKYGGLGYSHHGYRIESEISNTIESEFDKRTVINTGINMWHFLSPKGGCRMRSYDSLPNDDKIYWDRWGWFHKKRVRGRKKK